MLNSLEKLIRLVYAGWKKEQPSSAEKHPDEETLACFLEGRLPVDQEDGVRAHILRCDSCLDAVVSNLNAQSAKIIDLPEGLLERSIELVREREEEGFLEIILRFKAKAIEIINTSGDILMGQELVPAAVLRSRKIRDFKDEVIILKDFRDIRIEARVENKAGRDFNLIVIARKIDTQEAIKDLRITLISEDVELESYLSDSGSVTFEHVLLGKYKVEISNLQEKLASILLEIKV